MTAKVQNFCMSKQTKSINVESSEQACINCIWYEQYYREKRGNVKMLVPISIGLCLLNDEIRRALEQPCSEYEKEVIRGFTEEGRR